MIKNIIFDFGDIFINLDKQIVFRALEKFGNTTEMPNELFELNDAYEIGAISSKEFIGSLASIYPKATPQEIKNVWNGLLLDLPDERLHFIENFAEESTYRLFLLSNTNVMHIAHAKEKLGTEKFNRFKNSFEKFYLSHEINLRKPNSHIYEFVLNENGLKAEETFFIDDSKENTDAAEKLGITCWNLKVGQEDIIHLKSKL